MQLSHGRIGQIFDGLHATLHFIEDGGSACQERAPIGRQLNALGGAIEQADAERMFQIGDRLRHDRLRHGEPVRRPCHAPELCGREEDMEIAQFNAPADPVSPLHGASL